MTSAYNRNDGGADSRQYAVSSKAKLVTMAEVDAYYKRLLQELEELQELMSVDQREVENGKTISEKVDQGCEEGKKARGDQERNPHRPEWR